MQRSEAQLMQFSRFHVAAAFLVGAASCGSGSHGFCKEVSRETRTLRIPRTLNPSLFDICVNSGDCKYLCQAALPQSLNGTKEDVESCAPPADGGSAQAADAGATPQELKLDALVITRANCLALREICGGGFGMPVARSHILCL